MSGVEHSGFDLIDQPWILVSRVDGCVAELSLRAVFEQAHELTAVVGEVPTQTFAITRMLLAVLHRALDGPANLPAWQQLWAEKALPAAQTVGYLDQHRDRFDLFHRESPFFQVADLRTGKGEVSGLEKLIAEVPNGRPFFTMRRGTGTSSLSFAEAARWVVHCQAFDPSGIKSGAVGDERVKGGKGYPIGTGWSGYLGGVLPCGSTLRETLLFNLIARDFGIFRDSYTGDLPAWERPTDTAAEQVPGGRAPTGPLDLYTWQSRRIKLFHDHERVTGVLVCNGERITPQDRQTLEPHTAWRRSKAQEKKLGRPLVYMPREHVVERSIWRGLESLLPGVVGSAQTTEGAAALTPEILEWVATLQRERALPTGQVVSIRTIGTVYGPQSATTEEIIDDALNVAVAVLPSRELGLAAVDAGKAAENGVRALGSLAANLAVAAGGEADGPRTRAQELAYSQLDQPFRKWVAGLGLDSGPDIFDLQADWHLAARKILQRLGAEQLAAAGDAAWMGRTVTGRDNKARILTAAHADTWFRRDLRKALPHAYPIESEPLEATR